MVRAAIPASAVLWPVGSMHPALLLLVYCALIVAASLLGGWLPSRMRLTHTRMQLTMSFVAGLMLGVGLLHMFTHSLHGTGSPDASVTWLLAGLLTTFFLIRLFQFHQHAPADDEHQLCDGDHGPEGHQHHDPQGHACAGHHHEGHSGGPHELSWVGVAVGLALHSALDGVAVAASLLVEARRDGAYLFGLGTFLGVLLHKPLDALSVTSLMAASGWPLKFRQMINAAFALMCPLGALVFYFGLRDAEHDLAVGCALAFSAGVFVCIALSDLLPELQFHTHDRIKLSLALLLGVLLAWCVGFFEPKHAHGKSRERRVESREPENRVWRSPRTAIPRALLAPTLDSRLSAVDSSPALRSRLSALDSSLPHDAGC
jgi:zinc and cadmium transporter